MKDELISFETAKLAKEKGLIEGILCHNAYCIGFGSVKEDRNWLSNVTRYGVKKSFHLALAPTQSVLQKWLREKHKIHIWVIPWNSRKRFSYLLENEHIFDGSDRSEIFKTYEEALEAGLFNALKLIK